MLGESAAKMMIFAGLAIAAIGGIYWLLARAGFRGMPGDINVQRDGFSFSFPVVTCIVLSIVLTIVLNIFLRK